jgi:hypothetical protein
MAKRKRTDNDLQNTTQKTKDRGNMVLYEIYKEIAEMTNDYVHLLYFVIFYTCISKSNVFCWICLRINDII